MRYLAVSKSSIQYKHTQKTLYGHNRVKLLKTTRLGEKMTHWKKRHNSSKGAVFTTDFSIGIIKLKDNRMIFFSAESEFFHIYFTNESKIKTSSDSFQQHTDNRAEQNKTKARLLQEE